MHQEQMDDLGSIGASLARPDAAQLPPLSSRPTLAEILTRRLHVPKFGLPISVAQHGAQCAKRALHAGVDEETVLACLLHDLGLGVARPDHGWWGAQLVEPYVSERVSWAIRYHQALRFYPDPEVGYEYPEMYVTMFGAGFQPPEYIERAYREARNHRWYMTARHITLYDDYSFDRSLPIDLDPFMDLIARHFRQPEEGLGNDASPVAHMWRSIVDPYKPL
ncbi:MAG TPA: hypothetical protein VNM24_03910 [Burkholderiales bacterium]|nr:hypothetical protein [Burkholderiales bacterium]